MELNIEKLKAKIEIAEHRLDFLNTYKKRTIIRFKAYLIALLFTLTFAIGFLIPLIVPLAWSNLLSEHQIFYSFIIMILVIISTILVINILNLRNVIWQFDIIINEGKESILFAKNCININRGIIYGNL